MNRRSRWSRLLFAGAYGPLLILGLTLDMRARVQRGSAGFITDEHVPARYTVIVLGCMVRGEQVSSCLEERLGCALELYHAGKAQRFLLSGDHGSDGYDEVNSMMDWLTSRGVPPTVIFLDHAGFDTYDTMVRAHEVFAVDNALIVSQAFHLPRAVYLARHCGIDAIGVPADPPGGSSCRGGTVREPIACLKAVWNVAVRSAPTFLGPRIPITGDPQASFDRSSDTLRP